MNIIWFLLMCVSIIFSIINGRLDDFTKAMFDASKLAVETCMYLLGIVSLWLGLTKILEDSGLIFKLSHFFRPVISRLFKNIPPDHPSITSITLNLLANLFGLGNAATPLGIKAMKDLQTLNPDPETVTFEMMLFTVINTSSIQIIPFTVIGLLANYGSKMPTAIVLPTIIATVVSTVAAVGVLFLFKGIKKWK
ncbi:MAG: spore maturation protein [Elusimicrobia bacterium]|nr:spore maturation protein [Elusimicrobiota bacterium]